MGTGSVAALPTHHLGAALKSLCFFQHLDFFFLSISRECVRKCFSSRVASTNTWKSFLMGFTKGSCLFLMSGLPWPTTVLWYQVSQPRSGAYIVSGQNHSPLYTRCSGKAARTAT